MIKSLHISNYALLKNVSIYFTDGFTVVSGETGAGKSIMLDALSLLLGKRVERFSNEKCATKSIVEGKFKLDKTKESFFIVNNLCKQKLLQQVLKLLPLLSPIDSLKIIYH